MISVSEVRTSEGWGVADDDEIRLEDGRTTPEADAKRMIQQRT
jgi:hypothetical protein